MRQLGVLAVVCVLLGGPWAALAMLLNFRDRREDRLLGMAATKLSRMGGTVAVRVRCAAFWPTGVVRLNMWLCTPQEMWDTSLRVLERLPPGVRLVVEGPVTEELVGALSLVARRRAVPGRRWPADSREAPDAAPIGDHLGLCRAAATASRLGAPTRR